MRSFRSGLAARDSVSLMFCCVFLPLAFLVLAGIVLFGRGETEKEMMRLQSRETLYVNLGAGVLAGKIESIASDLDYLAAGVSLHDILDDPQPRLLSEVAEHFVSFARSKKIYNQLRWIDESGMERVRVDTVNGVPIVVADAQLQSKRGRYFFSDTMKLAPGEVFVSPLDLNIEQDKIEEPFKPMLRVATPVADSQGLKRGIVIINYFGSDMLQEFTRVTEKVADHVMMLNRDGYWLKSPKVEDEWGFMFKRPELSLAVRSPDAWLRLSSAPSGQVRLADGLWTWQTVYPLVVGQRSSSGAADAFVPSHEAVGAQGYFWKSVSHLSAATLDAMASEVWWRMAWIGGMLLAVLALVSWRLARAWVAQAAAEAGLASSEARLRAIIEGGPESIRLLDGQGCLVEANPAGLALMECDSLAQLSGLPMVDRVVPSCREEFLAHLARAAAGHPSQLEYEIEGLKGRCRWLESHAVPLCLDGRALVLEFSRDITGRKQTEHDLENYHRRLESMVAERTMELRLAMEAAETGNRAKTTFLANMSHDLRTPMTGVLGMIELARRRMIDPLGLEELGKAKLSAERLLSVLNNILDLSKHEAERMVFDDQPLKLAESLANVNEVLASKAEDKGLRLVTAISPALASQSFLGDPLRLEQILSNLAGNAIKFSERGEVALRVRAVGESAEAVQVRFEVADSGIGIEPAIRARLFADVGQGTGLMVRKLGGPGLGLATSKKLVQMMGGQIGVESVPGQGSTFWFVIPLKKQEQAVTAPTPESHALSAEQRLHEDFSGANILLAKDEPINREVTRGLLEEAGLSVDLAEDGQQALDLARQKRYDLILMDMQMPKLNGIEAARAILADSLNRQTPILAVTANAFGKDRQACFEAGMSAHIAKPLDPEKFYGLLLAWLASRRDAGLPEAKD